MSPRGVVGSFADVRSLGNDLPTYRLSRAGGVQNVYETLPASLIWRVIVWKKNRQGIQQQPYIAFDRDLAELPLTAFCPPSGGNFNVWGKLRPAAIAERIRRGEKPKGQTLKWNEFSPAEIERIGPFVPMRCPHCWWAQAKGETLCGPCKTTFTYSGRWP